MGIVEDEKLHGVGVDQIIIDPEDRIVGIYLSKHFFRLLILLDERCHGGGA